MPRSHTIRATFWSALIAIGAAGPVHAQVDPQDLYLGAGLNYNDVGSGWDNALGMQLFGGLEIHRWGNTAVGAEVGYMDSGTFEHDDGHRDSASGLWSTALGTIELTPRVYLLGRLGLDFGDDDGLMAGIGVGSRINRVLDFRGELVERDDITSLQGNLVLRFNP